MPQSFPLTLTDCVTSNLKVTQQRWWIPAKMVGCGRPGALPKGISIKGWEDARGVADPGCPHLKCLFLKEKGLCNDVQLTEGQNKMCFVCREEPTFIRCPTVKICEFSTDKAEADIYHFGCHICWAIPNKRNLQVESKLEEDFQKHASLKPSEAAANTLVCTLKKTGSMWDQIEALTESLSDSRRIQNMKAKAKKSLEQNGHLFDALCEFKKFCDEKDPF